MSALDALSETSKLAKTPTHSCADGPACPLMVANEMRRALNRYPQPSDGEASVYGMLITESLLRLASPALQDTLLAAVWGELIDVTKHLHTLRKRTEEQGK